MKLLQAVQVIVEKPYMEGAVEDAKGVVGVLYWDDFTGKITIDEMGVLYPLSFDLKKLQEYNDYFVSF